MKLKFSIVAAALILVSPAIGFAQSEEEVQTVPEDFSYGQHELAPQAHFPALSKMGGRVDRRGELNPLANRSIAWSSGYLPPKGTIQLQNTLLLGQSIAYSLSDNFQLAAQASLPLIPQTYLGLNAQGHIASGDAWKLTAGGKFRHRRTNLAPGTNDTGLTLEAVVDIIGSDDLSWNVGASLHVPLRHSLETVDSTSCTNRRELAEGHCIQTEAHTRFMPPSGYWFAAYMGANYFVADWLLFTLEFFTGASQSNFWAFDSVWESVLFEKELSYEAEQELVESTRWSAGLGPIGPVGLGLGTTWIYRRFAINGSVIAMSVHGEPQVMPFITIGLNLGG